VKDFGALLQANWRDACIAGTLALLILAVYAPAWVTERKDVLSALFWMLALWSYAHYVALHKPGAYVLTLLLYGLGLRGRSAEHQRLHFYHSQPQVFVTAAET
jgi:hypothetical protein